MAYISEGLRQEVTDRARGRCEYCQTQQVIVVSMEIDHIVPESAGGETTLDRPDSSWQGNNYPFADES